VLNNKGRQRRFRDTLSGETRPLKHPGLVLVADEPRRAGLRKKPKEHRRNFPPQKRAS
jgi:hypothetical protein